MTREELDATRELMDNISPKFLSYSQRCDLINRILIQCDEIERQATEIERLKIERDARDQRVCELFDEVKVLQDALAMIRRIKSRDHNDALKRLQNIDNIACQALGGNFMTDTYTDEENERLRGALERIGWKMMNHNPMELRAIARQALKGDE